MNYENVEVIELNIAYPYIAIDLDGTLLNADKRISYADFYAIKLYTSLGGKVILATGRSPLSTAWVAENLGIEKSLVAFNGAYIQFGDEKQYDFIESRFQVSDIEYLLSLCDNLGLEYLMYNNDSMIINEITPLNKRWLNDLLDFSYLKVQTDCREYSKRFKVIQWDKTVQLMNRILKFVVLPNKKDEFEKMFSILQNCGFCLNKTPRYIEITNNYYNKGSALEKILKKDGCTITEIMAIGDNYNDLSMLRPAKLGVVVANSPIDIREQIKNVTSSNNNNGVAEAIIHYAIY